MDVSLWLDAPFGGPGRGAGACRHPLPLACFAAGAETATPPPPPCPFASSPPWCSLAAFGVALWTSSIVFVFPRARPTPASSSAPDTKGVIKLIRVPFGSRRDQSRYCTYDQAPLLA